MSGVIHINGIFGNVTTNEFHQLILPLKNKLYRFALRYLANEAEAKDVVQEVMIKSWEDIGDPTSIRNLEAWCMTLTRNKSLDKLKKKGRNYLQIVDQYHLHNGEIDPLKQTEEKESASKIRSIISSLSENQREAITLRDVEGYSYQEIADIMAVSMNQVKALLFRARKSVKEQLIRENNYGISEAQ